MTVTPDDVVSAAECCQATLSDVVEGDWDTRAGGLDWSCARTIEHITNASLRYAAHLASRAVEPLPPVRGHDDRLTPADLLVLVGAAAAVLAETARAAPADARGFHPAGMADAEGFLAMGCDEILVHTFDAAAGLGLTFDAPPDLAERVLGRLFPWVALEGADAWQTLLWANGRVELERRPRLDPDWSWQCAPLTEWDGAPKLRVKPGSW
jgi:hypothetical protein